MTIDIQTNGRYCSEYCPQLRRTSFQGVPYCNAFKKALHESYENEGMIIRTHSCMVADSENAKAGKP
jgi:hypothetical protein